MTIFGSIIYICIIVTNSSLQQIVKCFISVSFSSLSLSLSSPQCVHHAAHVGVQALRVCQTPVQREEEISQLHRAGQTGPGRVWEMGRRYFSVGLQPRCLCGIHDIYCWQSSCKLYKTSKLCGACKVARCLMAKLYFSPNGKISISIWEQNNNWLLVYVMGFSKNKSLPRGVSHEICLIVCVLPVDISCLTSWQLLLI